MTDLKIFYYSYPLSSGVKMHVHYKNGELVQFDPEHQVKGKINTHGSARGLENSLCLKLIIVDS